MKNLYYYTINNILIPLLNQVSSNLNLILLVTLGQ